MTWIDRYQEKIRPDLVIGRGNATLFLTTAGEAFTPDRQTQLVRGYVIAAEMGDSGSCHLFRHTMPTLMLENGADIRYIQAMLGHAVLSITQIYIRKLKEIHTATHPGKPRRARVLNPSTELDAESADETTGTPTEEAVLAASPAEALEAHAE